MDPTVRKNFPPRVSKLQPAKSAHTQLTHEEEYRSKKGNTLDQWKQQWKGRHSNFAIISAKQQLKMAIVTNKVHICCFRPLQKGLGSSMLFWFITTVRRVYKYDYVKLSGFFR